MNFVSRCRAALVPLAVALIHSLVGESPLLAKGLQVGAARQDITPTYPIRLNGFGFRRTESEGITQPIWAKALAFEDPSTGPAILIAIDNLGVPDYIHAELSQRLSRSLGLKPERLCLTATHTHTAPLLKDFTPTIFSVPIPASHLEHVDRYTGELIDAMERVALSAWKSRREATLAHAVGTVSLAANRRTTGGPVDHDLPVLTIRDLSGSLIAVYTSYACHCVTLSNNKISGDWAGYAQKAIEEAFPGIIAVTSVGCGADSNPRSGVVGDKADIAESQGKEIAQEIVRLLKTPMRPVVGPLAAATTQVILPYSALPTRMQLEARTNRQDAVGYHARFNLAKLDRGESLPASLPYLIQSWSFGNSLALVNLPGEVVVDYSLRLKREFDRARLWVNGYANNAPCYIPSERVLEEGGYEGGEAMVYYDRPTKFAPGLEKIITDGVRSVVPKAFAAPRGTDGTRPLKSADALRTFRTPPGTEMELVASEPLIVSPVAIDWGADARLWVCEMYDYPQGLDNRFQPGGRIRCLRPDPQRGSYQRSSVFLDSIPFPTGVFAWGFGILVCAAPDILYAEDTDNDGRADRIVRLFSGFSTENYQARVNGLSLGLDGWIYGANGLLGGIITNHISGGTVDIRGRDFRFQLSADLTQARFEPASGLTQQGRVRSDWDDWFGCDNSTLIRHFPMHDHYVRRNPWVPGPTPSVYPPDEANSNQLFPISRALERFNDLDHLNKVTSACGLGVYRDNLLGKLSLEDALTCEPVHNLVHRLHLIPDGPLFKARRDASEQESEFLSSTDNWFRPVQVRTGPDGALWVVDMYRFLMEHPRWISPRRLSELDMRAGSDMGRLYRLKPMDRPLRTVRDLTQLSPRDLVASLETSNGTERDRVQLALFHHKTDDLRPSLESLASASHQPEVRAQALSTLAMRRELSPSTLLKGLTDSDPRVVAEALQLSERLLSSESSLGDKDPFAETFWRTLEALSLSKDARVRYQLALSLGESSSARSGRLLGLLATSANAEEWLRSALVTSASHHAASMLQALAPTFKKESEPGAAQRSLIDKLLVTLTASGDTNGLESSIAVLVPSEGRVQGWRLQLLSQLFNGSQPVQNALASMLRAGSSLATVLGHLEPLINSESAPLQDRLAALSLLGRIASNRSNDLALLLSYAVTPSNPELRQAALNRLLRLNEPRSPGILMEAWARYTPNVRGELLRNALTKDSWSQALLSAIASKTVPLNEISELDRQPLLSSRNPEIRQQAQRLFPRQERRDRDSVLARYQHLPPAPSGAEAHGKELFLKNCATCHRHGDLGVAVGPELTALAGRDSDFWIKNILDPNAVIEPRFVAYQIELSGDRSLTGIVSSETATSLALVQPGGISETLLRSEITGIRALGLSLMPEGFEQTLSPTEMSSLLQFLRNKASSRSPAQSAPGLIAMDADHSVLLQAKAARIQGPSLVLETPFQNLGMWHGVDDEALWTVRLDRDADYDIHLDYACAAASAGNQFAISIGEGTLSGGVAPTGSDWSRYAHTNLGRLHLTSGVTQVRMRATRINRGALMDLRGLYIVPTGTRPRWPDLKTSPPSPSTPPRDTPSLARILLDPSAPEAEKEGAATTHPHLASAILREMTRDLIAGTPEERRRIPWLWRLALLTARRDDAAQILDMLETATPAATEPLREWQAVVLGGGLINGLSQLNRWPRERLEEIVGTRRELSLRWRRALALATLMADDASIPTGTRYDALRMCGVLPWSQSGACVTRYLAPDAHEELRTGALAALADIEGKESTDLLIKLLPGLNGSQRDSAVDALMRGKVRTERLQDEVRSGRLPSSLLGSERSDRLRNSKGE